MRLARYFSLPVPRRSSLGLVSNISVAIGGTAPRRDAVQAGFLAHVLFCQLDMAFPGC